MSTRPAPGVTEVQQWVPAMEKRTYRGLGEPIPIIDANDALAVLAHDKQIGVCTGARDFQMSKQAARLLAAAYGYTVTDGIPDDDDDDDADDEDAGTVDLDELAWARTRAQSGNVADALIHLTRAVSDYPDATFVCDAIAKRLP
jgi:hypothetical protein